MFSDVTRISEFLFPLFRLSLVFFESVEHPLLEIRPLSETSDTQNQSNTDKIIGLSTPS